MLVKDVTTFLAHAIQVEHDAARRYEDLTHSMEAYGNTEVEALFRQLGELSRRHLKWAMARGAFQTLPHLGPGEFEFPDGISPEAVGWQGVDAVMDELGALEVALQGEVGGFEYYKAVAQTTKDPEIRRMAAEFAQEESEHVSELERWIKKYRTEGPHKPKGRARPRTKSPPP
jgi:rubrerythrin